MHKRLLLGFSASLILVAACSSEPSEHVGQTQKATHGPIPQANDRAYVVRASIALLGRPPVSGSELASFTTAMGTSTVLDERRSALIDFLMRQEDFVRHWTSVLYDLFRVSRDPSLAAPTGRTNTSCWDVGTNASPELADYLALNSPASTNPLPAGVSADYSMLDVVRTSVQSGDVRNVLRANFFAQMTTPLPGNQMTERNIRADYWTRFEREYLNRQLECLGCHNTRFSITGTESDWNRFYPMPDRVEEATLGSVNASRFEPPDLMADFRFNGVAGRFSGGSFVPGVSGGQRPWQMRAACGTFAQQISPETDAQCSTTPAEQLPPDNPVGQQDVCFHDGTRRRAPKPTFARAETTGSVYRLEQIF